AEAGRRFRQFAEGAVLVAHNAPFDMAFLRRDADAVGASLDSPVLDTVLLSAALYGAEATHTLDAIADRLEVDIPDSLRHTALGDAEATAAVFLKMLPMLEARGIVTFGAALTESRAHSRILPDLNSG
ncbi:MAG: exonuclease domain-containing protein, partial [Rhodobacter sp.]|nr:exonuclease domain-containing protein [Rhodobacter sp.]